MPTPRITVLLPVYNAGAFVDDAVQSILAQTFTDFELLCIDDGSTDGSVARLDQLAVGDSRIRVIHQPNAGLVQTLNRGIAEARGELIARMDADDIALPDRLAKQVAFLDQHPAVAVVGGAAAFFNAKGLTGQVLAHPAEPEAIRVALAVDSAIVHPAAVIRRSALAAVGGYRQPFTDAEDYDLWLRLAEKFDLANLPDIVLHYRFHEQQVSVRKVAQQVLSRLGARASAKARQAGLHDPAESASAISGQVLRDWGVPSGQVENALLAAIDGPLESLLRSGNLVDARQVLADLAAACPVPGRVFRSRLTWYDVKMQLAQRHFLRGTIKLAKAAWFDWRLFPRLVKAAWRRS